MRLAGSPVSEADNVTVNAISLDSIVAEHGDIDLLKLDIEGAEPQVIPSASVLSRVRRVVAELHLFQDGEEQPIVDALKREGFRVTVVPSHALYTPKWVWPVIRNSRRLQGEALIKLGLVAY